MSATATASAIASATSSAAASSASDQPASYKIIGVILAITSGFFIGVSFVVKKKGLLSSQAKTGCDAGAGHAYLKSWIWWTGMTLMIIGEICNFVAYAFTEAILVTPLGAVSVIVSAILSHFVLKERLSFFGWTGCALAVLGSVIVCLNAPEEDSATTIPALQHLFLTPGFLVYAGLCIVGALGLVIWDRKTQIGQRNMLIYISICSVIGGLSVACLQGVGSSILTSIRGDNQFKHWFMYIILPFVICTLLIEINYLNKALAIYNTASVSPSYFVIFTAATLITSCILYQGFKTTAVKLVSLICGFLVTACGVILLQLSKVEPEELVKELDRSSTMLLAATRAQDNEMDREEYELKSPVVEGPSGMGMAEAVGTIGRAISMRVGGSRRGSVASSQGVVRRHRMGHPGAMGSGAAERGGSALGMHPLGRHQLYDAPMPYDAEDKVSMHSAGLSPLPTSPTSETSAGARQFSALKFSSHDTTHLYNPKAGKGLGVGMAVHGTRQASRDRTDSHPTPVSPRTADVADSTFTPNVGGFISPDASPATSFSTTQAFPSSTPRGSITQPGHEPNTSVSTAARYRDPYAGNDELVSPKTSASGTFPRHAGAGGLADMLKHEFAQSAPNVSQGVAAEAPISPTTAGAGGHKFTRPFAGARERTQSGQSLGIGGGKRVPIPHGHHKADQSLDRLETEGLMSPEPEEEGGEGFADLEVVETRDTVGMGDYRGRLEDD